MATTSTVASGALVTLIGQWIRFMVQVASFAVLSRILAPADFGLFAMVMGIAGVASILGDFGLSSATVQSQSVTRTQLNNVFWANVIFGLTLTAIGIAAAPLVAHFYHEPDAAPVFRVASLVFLLNTATLQFRAEAMRGLRFTALALADVIGQGVGVALAILSAILGAGVWALVAQQLCAALVPLIFLPAALRWMPGRPSKAPMRGLTRFAANITGVQIINYLSSNIDTVLVGRFSGASATGFYARAFQVVMLPIQQLLAPLGRVALPVLSQARHGERESLFVRIHLVTTYIVLGALSLIAALGFPLVELGFGPGWDETKGILLILIAGGALEVLSYPLSWLYASTDNTGLLLRVTLAVRPVMIVLILGGATQGPEWTAVSVTVGFLFNWLAQFAYALPRLGVRVGPMLGSTLRPLALYSCALGITSPLAWLDGTWDRLWLQFGSITALFGASLLILSRAPIFRNDLDVVIRAARLAVVARGRR